MTDQPREGTYIEGRHIGAMLAEFRHAHPRHARFTDDQIIAAAGEFMPTMGDDVRLVSSGDAIERGSAREDLYRGTAGKLSEKSPTSFGDILSAAQKKTGLW